MEKEKRVALHKLEKRMVMLLDATLAGLYTLAFGISLYASGYTLDTVAVLAAIHSMLLVLGWRNPPINIHMSHCVLYRTAFLPLFASLFTLAAWFYAGPRPIPSLAALAASFATAYALYKTLALRLSGAELVTGIAAGLAAYTVHSSIETIPVAFAAPQIAAVAAHPGILCDDRPVLYVIGLYAVATAMACHLAL